MSDTVKSPCTEVCIIDEKSGYCEGCLRTPDEIAGWPRMRDEEKLEVLTSLRDRKIAG
ncbi:MAG: DUF1289 domain-containing protein [Deltaproteobacteria bacterium]